MGLSLGASAVGAPLCPSSLPRRARPSRPSPDHVLHVRLGGNCFFIVFVVVVGVVVVVVVGRPRATWTSASSRETHPPRPRPPADVHCRPRTPPAPRLSPPVVNLIPTVFRRRADGVVRRRASPPRRGAQTAQRIETPGHRPATGGRTLPGARPESSSLGRQPGRRLCSSKFV